MNTFNVINPFDGSIVAELERTSEKESFDKLTLAYDTFIERKNWLPPYKRIEILEKAQQIIRSRADQITRTAVMEGGKPYIDSAVEINRAIDGMGVAVRELAQMGGREIPMNITLSSANRMAYTIREPRGVSMAISAFNHPFNLIVHQVIPAIAVGCPVIVKPSSSTPLSCQILIDILYESGLPQSWCQMVLCENEVAEKLVADPRVSFLTFIGSARVGWHLRSILAPGAPCALEHGGAAPVIFTQTGDMDKTIPLLVKGGFYHAGQVCVSVQRIFVHNAMLDDFATKFTQLTEPLRVGDPLDQNTEVGPLIFPKEVDRVAKWVAEARQSGGEILCGGKKLSDTCYAPTVILNPPEDAKVSQKEIFGPVVCLYGYDDIDDAIRRANQLDFAFQASVFTKDLDTALYTVKHLNALAVMVNDHTAFRVDWMPFGGYKQSGLGVGGIGPSMLEMTLEKLMIIKSDGLID